MTCPACGGLNGREHSFREMKYGTRDKFTYWECLSCGCLQIAGIPDNIASYYRDDFYQPAFRFGPLELWLYQAYRIAPRFVGRFRQAPEGFRAVLEAGLEPGARILDVGCGGGKLVRILRSLGYEAHGIDPFVHEETPHVSRKYLEDTSTWEWDMIMFHHSLEHMTDHVRVLSAAREH